MMVWSVTDDGIEDPRELERQFEEIRSAGFGGVAAFVRCSRYTWADPEAHRALAVVGRLCRARGLTCWLGPDPRFISRPLLGGLHGLDVAHCGDSVRAEKVPNLVPVHNGRYSVRCVLPPRHSHMFHEVAVEFSPSRPVRVLAVRSAGGPVRPGDIVDLTSSSRFFYNARDRYVEAFGAFLPPREGDWGVFALFGTQSSHVDFSDATQMRRYHAALAGLKKAGARLDGLMWDEPGFTCTYGSYPWSGFIHRVYQRTTGRKLESDSHRLLLDQFDGSHVPVRVAYFRAVQSSIVGAQRRAHAVARSLWGRGVHSGIHDTWHFESADMCDMNHGSLDLWASLPSKTGGFVDLGGIQELKDPESPHYANLAAMSVVAASLGRHSSGRYACNNLWTVGDDDGQGWQTTAMDHCVNIMSLFGTRWLAHAYGPVGTVGEEWTFLGSSPLPGYPRHSTWPSFPGWIRRMNEHIAIAGNRLPSPRLLVVFPVETLYALGDSRADAVAREVFVLVRTLLDSHHHIEVLSPALVAHGRWEKGGLRVGRGVYQAVLYPHPDVTPRGVHTLLRDGGSRVCFAGGPPRLTEDGATIRGRRWNVVADPGEAAGWAGGLAALRPVEAPSGSWVSMTAHRDGVLVTLAPARAGRTFGGAVTLGGKRVSIPSCAGLARVMFGRSAPPRLLDSN
jgi:hypothetical protein